MSTKATKPYHNRIALAFDYDDTLAPDSYAALLARLGHDDADAWKAEHVEPLEDEGWDHIMARFYALIEESRRRADDPITRQLFEELGQNTELFDGVPDMFDRVRETAQNVLPDVEVEFYLITSGAVEPIRATSIAGEFEAIWGCAFHFDEDDEIAFVKRILTHPEKTRYLLELSKGMTSEGTEPEKVWRDVDHGDLHVPLDQMIFVGDGASDMPAFELMNEYNGLALGIFKGSPADWRGNDDITEDRRVQNLAPADYTDGSELMRSLELSVESICKRIALRKLGAGE